MKAYRTHYTPKALEIEGIEDTLHTVGIKDWRVYIKYALGIEGTTQLRHLELEKLHNVGTGD